MLVFVYWTVPRHMAFVLRGPIGLLLFLVTHVIAMLPTCVYVRR